MRTVATMMAAFLFAGCSALRARDHPCYPFIAHEYHDRIPADVMKQLAHDPGARKVIGHDRAPIGAYWRRRRKPGKLFELHQVIGDYELTPCPGIRITAPTATPE